MEEQKPDPQIQSVFEELQGRPPRSRRWMLPALAIFYTISAVASLFLLWHGSNSEPVVSHRTSLLATRRFLASQEPGVAWIYIHGPIFESESGRPWDVGMEQWNRRIQNFANRADVKAIVLDINSPGGSVGAVQELYRTIQRVREEKKKPIVTMVGDVAASGGFYLAAATDKIVAHPGSLVGSIGVIFETMNFQQLMAKLGIQANPIKSGKMKDIGSPTRPMTLEERKVLQGLIDDAYGQFLGAVSQGRNIPEDRLRPMADGRIFSGRQAKQLGLVDVLGDSQDALMLAGQLAHITGKPRIIRESDGLESVLDMLNAKLSDYLRPEASWIEQLKPLMSSGIEYRWAGF